MSSGERGSDVPAHVAVHVAVRSANVRRTRRYRFEAALVRAHARSRSGRPRRQPCSYGLTLLEVLLALAILGGALVAIGELMRLGVRNAEIARDVTTAQILCETIMSRIGAGLIPPQALVQSPVEDVQYQQEWTYSISVEQIDQEGLINVWVSVEQRPELAARPASFRLARWMIDPTVLQTEEL